jgi:hypothetical protein
MSEPVQPIGTQISALAELAPDEPAVTRDEKCHLTPTPWLHCPRL